MKPVQSLLALTLLGSTLLLPGAVRAAETKTYQVTGPILELTPTKIVVQKGDEKWEIARSKKTKVTGELKVGSKITVYYTLIAEEVEVKEEKKK